MSREHDGSKEKNTYHNTDHEKSQKPFGVNKNGRKFRHIIVNSTENIADEGKSHKNSTTTRK